MASYLFSIIITICSFSAYGNFISNEIYLKISTDTSGNFQNIPFMMTEINGDYSFGEAWSFIMSEKYRDDIDLNALSKKLILVELNQFNIDNEVIESLIKGIDKKMAIIDYPQKLRMTVSSLNYDSIEFEIIFINPYSVAVSLMFYSPL